MSDLVVRGEALSVSIDGEQYPQAVVQDCRLALLPDVGSATLAIPFGRMVPATRGRLVDIYPTIPNRAEVIITATRARAVVWEWRGRVIGSKESGSSEGLTLTVQCQGLAGDLARYALVTLPTVTGSLDIGTSTQAAITTLNDADTAALVGSQPDTWAVVAYPDEVSPAWWTCGMAVSFLLAEARRQLGLGQWTALAGPGGSDALMQVARWDLAGLTVIEQLQVAIGAPRGRAGWRWRVVDGLPRLEAIDLLGAGQTAKTLDLTRPLVVTYEIENDASATLERLTVVTQGWTRVTSCLWLAAGGSGLGLAPGWGTSDESAPYAPDNPAWAMFDVLDPGMLGAWSFDGAWIEPGLPVLRGSGAPADRTVLGASGPLLVFVKHDATTWEDWTDRVTVTIVGPQTIEVRGGEAWFIRMKTALGCMVTLALRNGSPAVIERLGGTGMGAGRIDVSRQEVRIDPGTATRVVDGDLTYTDATDLAEAVDLDAMADNRWGTLSQDRDRITWTENGLAAFAVGDAIGTVTLPGGRSRAVQGIIVERRVSAAPVILTTLVLDLPLATLTGVA